MLDQLIVEATEYDLKVAVEKRRPKSLSKCQRFCQWDRRHIVLWHR